MQVFFVCVFFVFSTGMELCGGGGLEAGGLGVEASVMQHSKGSSWSDYMETFRLQSGVSSLIPSDDTGSR